MNGHVFDYTGECMPEKYIRAMKELLAHVGLTYKEYTTELKEGQENLTLVDPTAPDNPPKGSCIRNLENGHQGVLREVESVCELQGRTLQSCPGTMH